MKGIESEWTRFCETCLEGIGKPDLETLRLVFMSGALAATNRFLSIMDSNLPTNRKQALIRRMAREAEAFQKFVRDQATASTTKGP